MTGDTPSKAEQTKSAIVDAAMELFTQNGYEQTTMRLIAERAGVSTGNAYYYFSSKEDLMQGFYDELRERFEGRVDRAIEHETSFEERLRVTLREWVENARPFHEFADGFFRHAANPKSPLSPFSPESEPTRNASIDVFARVIDGSEKLKMAASLRPRLPELLWLYQMGIVLFWVHDDSPRQKKTLALVDRTVSLVVKFIGLSRLPVLRNTADEVMELVDSLKPGNGKEKSAASS